MLFNEYVNKLRWYHNHEAADYQPRIPQNELSGSIRAKASRKDPVFANPHHLDAKSLEIGIK